MINVAAHSTLMPPFKDLTGQRYGRLTVLARTADYRPGIAVWNCQCICGTVTKVRTGELKHRVSCGCANTDAASREVRRVRATTHGRAKTRVWNTWVNMIQRCHNPNAGGFEKYGGRGITVCERWRESFEAFLADMGEMPTEKHTIDRIESRLNYTPDNCRWATMKEQQNNRTNNCRLTLDGETMTLMQWSERLGVDRHTIRNRLNSGWPMAKVLSSARHGRGGKLLSK